MSCTASLGKEFNVVSPREVDLYGNVPFDRANLVKQYMYGNNRFCASNQPNITGTMCGMKRAPQPQATNGSVWFLKKSG